MPFDPRRLRQAYLTARDALLAERTAQGHWSGELSASALSTATAISALSIVDRSRGCEHRALVERGIAWLLAHQNADGGWGDTDKSLSNVATTMLVQAAIHLAGAAGATADELRRAGAYVEQTGALAALRRRYGRDKTFVVPILTNCALAGLADWRDVAPLPFELACLPHWLWRWVRLPVVSYAIPALVAIGQARYFHAPPRNPLRRLIQRLAVNPSLKVLEGMVPHSGGFLEAVPLTSFVVMSLAATGRAGHPVVQRGVDFLATSARDDGSWPIDTNLATWTTTLSINALAASGEPLPDLTCLDWLLQCQHLQEHPFTHAAPGGWGWTDLSGAVPDADDTAGALLALRTLEAAHADRRAAIRQSAAIGLRWLLDLQNRDGGWPTFCRGWGRLPFDRSGVDLSAHALRAFHAWRDLPELTAVRATAGLSGSVRSGRIASAIRTGLAYIERQQRADGSWTALWFGNQHEPNEENPIYGTAKVLLGYQDLGLSESPAAQRGRQWLAAQQRLDGGWGPPATPGASPAGGLSSVEETALAVEALLSGALGPSLQGVLGQGLAWLVSAVESGRYRDPQPIGFYFARLWYYERLYPLTFTVSALGRALAVCSPRTDA